MAKVTILVVLARKQAYLQAGIPARARFYPPIGEIGHFCSLLDQNYVTFVTFTPFYVTFARFLVFRARFWASHGLPGPDSEQR